MGFPNTRIMGAGFAGGQIINGLDYEFFDDFLAGGYGTTAGHKFASSANVAEWLYTAIGGSTPTFIISDGERGGVVAAATGATTDNHGLEAQLNGEAYEVARDKDIYWEMRFKSQNAVANFDWVAGLATTETTVLASPAADFIGFTSGTGAAAAVLDSGAGNIIARTLADAAGTAWTASAATQTSLDTGSDLTADTFVTLAFWLQMNGSTGRVRFYVNGTEKFQTTSTIPAVGSSPMTPTFACQNNSTVQAIMEIDYIYCAQTR